MPSLEVTRVGVGGVEAGGQGDQSGHPEVDADQSVGLLGLGGLSGLGGRGGHEDGGVPAVPAAGECDRLDPPAGSVQVAGEALAGVVGAQGADAGDDEVAVAGETDGGPVDVVVDPDAGPADALLLEARVADTATSSAAGQRCQPVPPRGVSVGHGRLERVSGDRVPPRADAVDARPVVALGAIELGLDPGLGRDECADGGAGVGFGGPGGDKVVDLVAPAAVGVDLLGEGVIERPTSGAKVAGQGVLLVGGRVESETERPHRHWCWRGHFASFGV